MRKTTLIRLIVIGAIIVLAVYALYWTVAYHTFSDQKIEQLRTAGKLKSYENRIIRLGLDLQGGMHIVMELDLPKLVESMAVNKNELFYEVLTAAAQESKGQEEQFFDIFKQKAEQSQLKLVRHFPGTQYSNSDIIAKLEDESKDAVQRAIEIIRNRVDQFGVSEPTIQKAGKYRIIVELAGIKDPVRARELIQNTALLEFILVKDPAITQSFIAAVDNYLKTGKREEVAAVTESKDTTVALKESKDKAVTVKDLFKSTQLGELAEESADTGLIVDENLYRERPFSSLLRNVGNQIGVPENNLYAVKKILNDPKIKDMIPFGSKFLWSAKPQRITTQDGKTDNYYILYHLSSEVGLQGKYITKASANFGGSGTQASGQPIVNISMNSEGAKIFSRLTGANIGKQLAIVLDDKVWSAPYIRVKIPSGEAYIEGIDNMDEAKDIAIVLRAGALPAPVHIIEERSVGPTLGRDSINMGIQLGLIALVIVVVFMLFYYRFAGVLADLALILNILFVLAILSILQATLTLPGVAGIILTVGMAVDANVLIFERIREELDKGKTVRAAIDAGYSRAIITIFDANITTIFTALILMQFGTGPVKGFGTTLFWGIASSFFTAVFVTHTIFNWITERKVVEKLSI